MIGWRKSRSYGFLRKCCFETQIWEVVVSHILCFYPYSWGDDLVWRAYFSTGLKSLCLLQGFDLEMLEKNTRFRSHSVGRKSEVKWFQSWRVLGCLHLKINSNQVVDDPCCFFFSGWIFVNPQKTLWEDDLSNLSCTYVSAELVQKLDWNYHHKSFRKSREASPFFLSTTSPWDAEVLVIFFISSANNKVDVVLLGHFSLDWRLPMVFSHLNNGPYNNYLAKAKLLKPLSVNGCQKSPHLFQQRIHRLIEGPTSFIARVCLLGTGIVPQKKELDETCEASFGCDPWHTLRRVRYKPEIPDFSLCFIQPINDTRICCDKTTQTNKKGRKTSNCWSTLIVGCHHFDVFEGLRSGLPCLFPRWPWNRCVCFISSHQSLYHFPKI